jgi:hypothetical protein
VSPEHLLSFTARHTIQVDFSPPLVVSPPEPIRVTATPLLASLRDTKGTVRLVGDDIDPVEGAMELSGELWIGTIPPASKRDDRPPAEVYQVEMSFVDSRGSVVLARRYTLEAAATDIDTSGYVAHTDDGELTFSDDNPKIIEERRVSEMAADVDVEGVVLDDHNLGIAYEPSMAPERYEGLSEDAMLAARCYDKTTKGLEAMHRRYDQLVEMRKSRSWLENTPVPRKNYYDDDDYRASRAERAQQYEERADRYDERDRMEWEMYRLKYRLIPQYEGKVAECTAAARVADVVYCPSETRWYYRKKVPCSKPMQP